MLKYFFKIVLFSFTILIQNSFLKAQTIAKAELISRITNAYPSFSPDGSQIAYMSNADGDFDIYVLYPNTSEQKIAKLTDAPGQDGMPVYSPDGSKIAFRSMRDGHSQIYIMNSDGTDQHNISNNESNDEHPFWSSDGKRILFCSDQSTEKGKEEKNVDIFEMNSDGSGVRQITKTPEVETYASWSPDDKKIVCRKIMKDDNWEVVVMNSDGSNPINLTNNDGIDGWPVWSPDGKCIAYTSELGDHTRIFIMNADGHNKIQVSDNMPTDDRQPWWHPTDSLLLFSRYTWFNDQTWYETSEIYITKIEN